MAATGIDQTGWELDARARVRDTALRQFAQRGFKGATVRGIAQEAGVSLGMVQRHFPSKQALREECDAHVFTVLRDIKDSGVVGGAVLEGGFLGTAHQAVASVLPYIAMVLVSDAPGPSRWFNEFAELYGEVLTSGEIGPALPEGEDEQAIVAVHTAMQLGLAIFAKHICHVLGVDEQDSSAVARIGRARVFLAATRLIDEQLEARMREGFDRYEREGQPMGSNE